MAKYKTIATTTWYTTAGQVGGKLASGYEFESVTTQEKKGVICRNETGTNKWIPVVNCTEITVTPPPVDPPAEIDLEQFDRIVMKRIGHMVNGAIEYGEWTYIGEKDLDV